MGRPKITVVGAGNVGATCAHWAAARELGDVVLVDVLEGMPQGKALDLMQARPIFGFNAEVVGANDYAASKDSQVVIITAGIPRKPGMSREDLINTNKNIVGTVTKEIMAKSPDAFLIVVANPLDAMCYVAKKVSGLPRERVMGMAGILDTARFRCFIAMELGVAVEEIQAMVLGGHGDDMVPVASATNISGVPLTDLLAPDAHHRPGGPHPQRRGGNRGAAQDRFGLLCPGGRGGADGRVHPQGPETPGAGVGLSGRGVWPERPLLRRPGDLGSRGDRKNPDLEADQGRRGHAAEIRHGGGQHPG